MYLTNMKKIILIVVVFITMCGSVFSQEIGVRFGNISGGNVAIDGIFGTSKFSRIHADISFGNGVGVDALWDFIYRPVSGEAFNWYLGAGPYTFIGDPFILGVAGEAGLEYRFNKVPLAIGIDWRPGLSIVETTDFHFDVFGVNVRYVFGTNGGKR
jgi:hypothetical protein